MLRFRALACCCSLLAVCACSKREPTTQTTESAREEVTGAAGQQKIDVCALLTPEEIAGVLGEPTKGTKRIAENEGGLAVAQCFYELPTYVNSFDLRVVQKASGAGARDPREVWKETFAPEKLQEAGRRAPEAVSGLGDAAFWRSHRKGAALYVLKGNIYLRIGVEGADDKETKMRRSSELARRALSRL